MRSPNPKLGLNRPKFARVLLAPYHWVVSPALHILSPLIGGAGLGCRYRPTCSHYAEEAIGRFGLLKGSRLALLRLLRCNPFSPGGDDPLPCQTVDIKGS